MARKRKRSRTKVDLEPRVKVWLELDGEYAFGSGISAILIAVAEAGSIKAAAASLGKSYRYVWSRIKSAEQTLGSPLVHTQVGGQGLNRSSLTALAEQLVQNYGELRQRMLDVVREEFTTRIEHRR